MRYGTAVRIIVLCDWYYSMFDDLHAIVRRTMVPISAHRSGIKGYRGDHRTRLAADPNELGRAGQGLIRHVVTVS
jgi:hypothetical protein